MKTLLTLARSPLGRRLTGWVFEHLSFAIPVERLRETGTLLAFRHPRPACPVHVLLVPKKAIGSLADLREEDHAFLVEALQTAHSLAAELGLAQTGYRLVLNGGPFQEVPQLHFHLISGDGRS